MGWAAAWLLILSPVSQAAAYQVFGVPPAPSDEDSTLDSTNSDPLHHVRFRHFRDLPVLDFYQKKRETDGSVSMAGTPWEASGVLADYLTRSSSSNKDDGSHPYHNLLQLEDKVVLELGAGIGICSVAAALMGAQVMATDASSTSLRLIRQNAQKYQQGFKYPMDVFPLLWGDLETIQLFPVPDIIIASDVIYHRSSGESLRSTIDAFCRQATAEGKDVEVLLAHTWRINPQQDEDYLKLYETICNLNVIEVSGSLLPTEYQKRGPDGRLPVSIYHMTPKRQS